ncbi:MAG: phytoene/squalene synthase family protein [Bacteroidetes bacterium]|nr:phytoene/squalene synthase family protein [Bacteroidota bacterium]
MNNKNLFDQISVQCSRLTTIKYSTSFSLGIRTLSTEFRDPIYAIYGYVRFADEIVDTFHGYDQAHLLEKFRKDTVEALEMRISLNPILNAFQSVVHQYNIEWELIDTFLKSMEMDLDDRVYDQSEYETYILGSAEVVGLMCLRVFTRGNNEQYLHLKPSAMRLGAAFQKINFLRDLKSDFEILGRVYFPGIDLTHFDDETKRLLEKEIEVDFREAYKGIVQLPKEARYGVYLAYTYYVRLFEKIRLLPASVLMKERVRIPNPKKLTLMFGSYLKHNFNLL